MEATEQQEENAYQEAYWRPHQASDFTDRDLAAKIDLRTSHQDKGYYNYLFSRLDDEMRRCDGHSVWPERPRLMRCGSCKVCRAEDRLANDEMRAWSECPGCQGRCRSCLVKKSRQKCSQPGYSQVVVIECGDCLSCTAKADRLNQVKLECEICDNRCDDCLSQYYCQEPRRTQCHVCDSRLVLADWSTNGSMKGRTHGFCIDCVERSGRYFFVHIDRFPVIIYDYPNLDVVKCQACELLIPASADLTYCSSTCRDK